MPEETGKNGTQPRESKLRSYRVKHLLRHNGKDYEEGKRITLDPKEAAAIGGHVLDLGKNEEEAGE